MALSKKALQRKREKKKQKRSVVNNTPSSIITSYDRWSVYEGWVSVDLWETGLGQVFISRRNKQGGIAVGAYLIDVYCLGVKDCFVRRVDSDEYQHILNHANNYIGALERIDSGEAVTLIYQAVAYAKKYGFDPHRDFEKEKRFLDNIPFDINEDYGFIFGKDGKPVYIPGVDDSPVQVKKIMQILELNKVQPEGQINTISESNEEDLQSVEKME